MAKKTARRSKIQFFLKRPSEKEGRRSFSILKRKDGKSESVKDERLAALNRALRERMLSLSEAEERCQAIVDELYAYEAGPAPKHNSENLHLLEKFWAKEFAHRRLISKKGSYGYYRRAVEALGSLSLLSAPAPTIQKRINAAFSGNKQRQVASKLNQLLKHLGRDVKLTLDAKEYPNIAHVSLADFAKVKPHLPDEKWRLLFAATIGSGQRISEVFAFRPQDIRDNGRAIDVRWQIDEKHIRRPNKNRKPHLAYVLPEEREAVKKWAALPLGDKLALRNKPHAKILADACRKAFPKDSERWITAHDLRHSYAIHLVSRGISLTQVAQSLGDSVQVAQEFYAGFSLVSEAIASIEHALGEATSK